MRQWGAGFNSAEDRMYRCAYIALYLAIAFAPAAQAAATRPEDVAAYACTKTEVGQGAAIDLSQARLTFEDNFDTPQIGLDGSASRWYTGGHSDFGGSKFLPYSPDGGPFRYVGGNLVIRLQKDATGWTSGMIQTVDSKGRGFSQQYGYFEMRAKFPPGQSNWPAFWLEAAAQVTDKTMTRPEIDVIEAYGGNDQNGYHASVHLWPSNSAPAGTMQSHWVKSCYRRIPDGLFDGKFHTYGALLDKDFVRIFFDRRELMRFPALPEFRQPMFMMVDLAYSPAEKRVDTAPSDMVVDYVRAWSMGP
jgi:beta-glucanase (GH16 family)